jgi:hypothetical protein
MYVEKFLSFSNINGLLLFRCMGGFIGVAYAATVR